MAWEPDFHAIVVASVPSLSLMQREKLTRALQVEGLDMVRAELASIFGVLNRIEIDDWDDLAVVNVLESRDRLEALLKGPLSVVASTSLSLMGREND